VVDVRSEHLVLRSEVAIKFLHPHLVDNRTASARFAYEARAAASLKSVHATRVLDVDRDEDGRPFLVMELLEGTSLDRVADAARIPLPHDVVVRWVVQACDAIAEAHERGIVHRDIKPANLFLSRGKSGEDIVKVLDFGLAKCLDDTIDATCGTRLLGSPQYMSPEQIRGERVGPASDIWSIGATIYELLTGRTPHVGRDVQSLFASILDDPPPRLRTLRPDIPHRLEAVVMRCLSLPPPARPSTVRELARELLQSLDGRSQPRLGDPEVTDSIRLFRFGALAVPALVAIGAIAGCVASLSCAAPAAPPPPPVAVTTVSSAPVVASASIVTLELPSTPPPARAKDPARAKPPRPRVESHYDHP
jgi:serine/threonine-protein kinase